MRKARPFIVLACALAIGTVLSACREEEQGRVLSYKKGVYLGKPDTPVSEDARHALRHRADWQRARTEAAGGLLPRERRLPDLRPTVRPAQRTTTPSNEAIRRRGQMQKFN